ncbi:MAG: glycoside hydrolase family 32 protein [Lachnospiraceae bacterium]
MDITKNMLNQQILAAEKAAGNKMADDIYRQGYHLMPPSGWMNDPNGLCWYKGNYHVFYQHSPLDANRGNIFWGHFTSPDLLNWTQQPTFLYPVDPWDLNGVYSGSALVEDDALYLYYTGNVKYPGDYDYIYEGRGHHVCLAVSKDGITPDSNQLLLSNENYPSDMSCHVRDPKVWKMDGRYYMVLGARTKNDVGELLIFESEDKLHWKHINVIKTPEPLGYMWECPDLFCVDGRWIVMTSPQGMKPHDDVGQNVYSCGYFSLDGDFRGEYTLGAYCELDAGFDFYAPQTFAAPDGRRIMIGWMGMPDADYSNPTTQNLWQHCMSVPRELHWKNGRLTALPVEEISRLRQEKYLFTCQDKISLPMNRFGDIFFYNQSDSLVINIGEDVSIGWKDGILRLMMSKQAGYGRKERILNIKDLKNIRLLLDASSLELFINDGAYVMTSRYYPCKDNGITIHGRGEGVQYQLRPMTIHWAQ